MSDATRPNSNDVTNTKKVTLKTPLDEKIVTRKRASSKPQPPQTITPLKNQRAPLPNSGLNQTQKAAMDMNMLNTLQMQQNNKQSSIISSSILNLNPHLHGSTISPAEAALNDQFPGIPHMEKVLEVEKEEDTRELEIEIAKAYQDLKGLELDKLVALKEAERESMGFEASISNNLNIAVKRDITETIQNVLMLDDSEDFAGKKAFIRKCNEFDFYVFPVMSVLDKLDSEEFRIVHQGLGDKFAIAISEALKVNKKIKSLILDDNYITPIGGEALMKALLNNKNIEHLDLSNNRLGLKGSAKDFGPMISDLLKSNVFLKTVILKGNKLGDRHVAAIAEAMAENSTLKALDLSYNEFGPRGGELIGQMLQNNVFLKSFSVAWNSLLNQGTVHLLNGLKNNNSITHINISWNGVSDGGAREIAIVLAGNTSLEEFNVSHNRIGKEGAKKIAAGIKDSNIKAFNISYNPLDEEGVKVILESLTENQTLTDLDMTNCIRGSSSDLSLMHSESFINIAQKKPSLKLQVMMPKPERTMELVEEKALFDDDDD